MSSAGYPLPSEIKAIPMTIETEMSKYYQEAMLAKLEKIFDKKKECCNFTYSK
jgi:hypothetical protein